MVDVCFYFEVHQPFRIKPYKLFDVGYDHDYWDHKKNKFIMDRVAHKCYLPTNNLFLQQIKEHPEFKVSFSITGTALEQYEMYCPEVIHSFQELRDTGNVEFINETYYHSLSSLFDPDEFKLQVMQHRKKIRELFDYKPVTFRNTELIYDDGIARKVADMELFDGIIAEGVERFLHWRSPNFVYKTYGTPMKLLLKNYKLSDDIAFRFSNPNWEEHPLTTEKYAHWVNSINGSGTNLNLFMDYETFGEHQWAETQIFNFLRALPREILKNPDNGFATPRELCKRYPAQEEVSYPHTTSWADLERDLSAWLENGMQKNAAQTIFGLKREIFASGDQQLIEDFRRLQTSDHFYYMCTKWFADGDVHKYFNPYDKPHNAFVYFINILNDLHIRLKEAKERKQQSAQAAAANASYAHRI